MCRLNRFVALVSLDGREAPAHLANTGRLAELLVPGATCYLADRRGPHRKTSLDLVLVAVGGKAPLREPLAGGAGPGPALVSVDTRRPEAVMWEAWGEGRLPGFDGYTSARQEVAFEDSRLDLLLEGPAGRCLVEVKSVTLVEGGVGLFPDAPTVRGRRHVAALARAAGQGCRAAALFVVQRGDAAAFAPNDRADPAFGSALRAAVAGGVEAHAFTCRVTPSEVRLGPRVPVLL